MYLMLGCMLTMLRTKYFLINGVADLFNSCVCKMYIFHENDVWLSDQYNNEH